ncbi:MAG: NADH-quinone oxidoreductase subunit M [Bdellovibrionales bacterium]|nr:NADH-quinone oxidoreductase subunit M [Bdellovibrionales bacterium]
MMNTLLLVTVFLPLFASGLLWFAPKKSKWIHGYGAGVSVVIAALSVVLFWKFESGNPDFQFVTDMDWISSFGIRFSMGMDGLSLVLFVLTSLLTFSAMLCKPDRAQGQIKKYVASLLVLESMILGTFAAMDAFLFYVFWEAMLLPMFLLIGIFGGANRIYATMKFFLYTFFGSIFMLIGMISLYLLYAKQFGHYSTSIADLYQVVTPLKIQLWLCLSFLLAFAVKVPIFPFHTWLPDAHVEAPTAGSVVLAGVLLKMGTYGMLRFVLPLFPMAATVFAPWICGLALIGIVYGAFLAWGQSDMKKIIAYSSVSHMGFIVLGIFSLTHTGISGAVFQMLAHGITTGALFLLIGYIYSQRHTRVIGEYGGIAKVVPKYSAVFFLVLLGSIGLPGLCGFVGEFLIFIGGVASQAFTGWKYVSVAVLGVVLGAGYMLKLYEKVFLGSLDHEENKTLQDLNLRAYVALFLPVVFVFVLGLFPNLVFEKIESSVSRLGEKVSHYKVVRSASLFVDQGEVQ